MCDLRESGKKRVESWALFKADSNGVDTICAKKDVILTQHDMTAPENLSESQWWGYTQ
jgi:hypothetical protein